MDIIKQIETYGIIPVVSIKRAEDAVPLAQALIAGGLPAIEVTFRTAAAADAIRAICAECPEVLVGAGTVLTVEQADAAIAAGAKFLVAPGLNPNVVRHAIARGVPMLPGCSSPSDFEAALELGLTHVKFFPAETLGGIKAIKAMTAPYGGLRVMATGGIELGNMEAYLANPTLFAVGGSFIAPTADISAGNFDKITANAKAAVAAMLGIEYAGVEGDCVVLRATSVTRAYDYLCGVGVAFGDVVTEGGKVVSVCLGDKLGGKTVKLVNK
ncbi:MAG: bifunctional 4-hydroxy-2-oxoglutarate aldolase/2-dehydro-3-deoxy-phosphogluconate aldolase [Clostridia bacterium]|nr:bifunctional 4-hydroxy-2-oxoglutarate aldolase/2-dehydro-3-deoxy-phosphogluconate aldolase [Clostridia bacterium]